MRKPQGEIGQYMTEGEDKKHKVRIKKSGYTLTKNA